MYDFGRLHRIQAVANFLDGGDEVFWLDQGGVIGDKGRVHVQVFVKVDVGMGDTLHVVKLLAHLGNASDFAHHARNGELRDGFFGVARAV